MGRVCSQNGGEEEVGVPLRGPRCRWKDNIRMDFKEICINTRNWVDSAQDMDYWKALVNLALDLLVS